jgi:geranylgeranyl pyrophosphate synthase
MLEDKAITSKIRAINKRIALLKKNKSKSLDFVLSGAGLMDGKRLRGLLVLLTAQACGAKINGNIINIAAAIELLHHATLIHDDIVDDSAIRRGAPSLYRSLGPLMAVLAGDYIFAGAVDMAVNDVDREMLKLFSGAIKDVCEGEIEEIYNKNNADMTNRQCLEIMGKKTASLIKCSVMCGAMAAKWNPAKAKHLGEFGYNIGMAFQIKDDLLDILSKTSKIGKPAGSDIKEGKAALPLVLALNNAPKADAAVIRRIFKEKKTVLNAKKILDFIYEYDGIDLAELMAVSYIEDAKHALDAAGLAAGNKSRVLYELADYMMLRNY